MKVHSTFFRRNLALVISAATCMAYSIAVNAQTQLEEIVVTAEFREASLQETPIAITAITGDIAGMRGVNDQLVRGDRAGTECQR